MSDDNQMDGGPDDGDYFREICEELLDRHRVQCPDGGCGIGGDLTVDLLTGGYVLSGGWSRLWDEDDEDEDEEDEDEDGHDEEEDDDLDDDEEWGESSTRGSFQSALPTITGMTKRKRRSSLVPMVARSPSQSTFALDTSGWL